MRTACRFVDRGLRPGSEHHAADLALLTGPAALHFGRHLPTASLGAFEAAALAIRGDFCRDHAIDRVRRPSGGGALYLDPGQLTWSLFLPRPLIAGEGLAQLNTRHAQALLAALGNLGLCAQCKVPNDIEVAGRKLASLFVHLDERGALLQGTLIYSVDTEKLLKVLRAPMEKLSAAGVQSARERFIGLPECVSEAPPPEAMGRLLADALADQFALTLVPQPYTAPPAVAPFSDDEPPQRADYAFLKGPGGVLHAWVRIEDERVVAVRVAGTLQAAPPTALGHLEQALIGTPAERLVARADELVQGMELLAWTAEAIPGVLGRALARRAQRALLGLDQAQANTLMLHGEISPQELLARARVMLVPYCAKPPDCTWRHRDGCPECGKCEVGDAYRLAREREMKVVTITRFEHLREVLGEMRAEGVEAYVGMCCQSFYLKRQYAFEEAGIPALLMDITGANCYELQQEDQAYAGSFEAQAFLDRQVVEKVMRQVPRVAGGRPIDDAGSEPDGPVA